MKISGVISQAIMSVRSGHVPEVGQEQEIVASELGGKCLSLAENRITSGYSGVA